MGPSSSYLLTIAEDLTYKHKMNRATCQFPIGNCCCLASVNDIDAEEIQRHRDAGDGQARFAATITGIREEIVVFDGLIQF